MKRRRVLALALVCGLLAGGCGGGSNESDEEARSEGLKAPTFVSENGDGPAVVRSSADEPAGASTTASVAGATTTTVAGDPDSVASDVPEPKESVSFDDPNGDATPGVSVGTPPPWTDLAGVTLLRQDNAYRLTVRLGGAAPQTSNGRETMNIASFYDTDGDDSVDCEIWVNLGPNGWGPVWYDDEGNARPGERSNVNVVIDGNEVRLLFPDVMLGTPGRFRFSVASEYGPLTSIGSASARRDDAPDNDQAVSFP